MKEIRIEKARRGMPVLLLTILAYILSIALLIVGIIMVENRGYSPFFGGIPLIVIAVLWMLLGWIFCLGLKVLKPPAPPSTSPLCFSFVLAAGFTAVQKGLTK